MFSNSCLGNLVSERQYSILEKLCGPIFVCIIYFFKFIMEFDDDDLLDDLLRDTSSDKFKSSANKSVDAAANSGPPLNPVSSSIKEKKSALLAELFGPSSSAVLDFEIEKPFSLNKPDNQVPISTAVEVLLDIPSFKAVSEEKPTLADFSLGSYVPSLGLGASKSKLIVPANNNLQQNTLPSTFSSTRTEAELFGPSSSAVLDFEIEKPFSLNKPDNQVPISTAVSTPPLIRRDNPPQLPEITPSISSIQNFLGVGHAAINPFQEAIEKLAVDVCKYLEILVGKENYLVAIGESMDHLQGSLNQLIQLISPSSSHQTDKEVELENRVAKLENIVEVLGKENQQLLAQLKMFEGKIDNQTNETLKFKAEIEVSADKILQLTKRMIGNLEGNVSNQLAQSELKTASQHQELFHKITNEIGELRMQMTKELTRSNETAKDNQVLQILNEEIKWLQQQKTKLARQREKNRNLNRQMENRLQHFNQLAEVNWYNFLLSLSI